MEIKQTGIGEFGPIYEGVHGQSAVIFLIQTGKGEVRNALYHKDIGNIDIIWGKSGNKGYGLAKITEKHPEAIKNLSSSIENGEIVEKLPARIILVDRTDKQRSIIDLQFNSNIKTWVVTSYIPIS